MQQLHADPVHARKIQAGLLASLQACSVCRSNAGREWDICRGSLRATCCSPLLPSLVPFYSISQGDHGVLHLPA